jgi:hypothetical protein
MQEKKLKINGDTKTYKFWYDKRHLVGGWGPNGVKGEFYNGKSWVSIRDLHTKQAIYNLFFKGMRRGPE